MSFTINICLGNDRKKPNILDHTIFQTQHRLIQIESGGAVCRIYRSARNTNSCPALIWFEQYRIIIEDFLRYCLNQLN